MNNYQRLSLTLSSVYIFTNIFARVFSLSMFLYQQEMAEQVFIDNGVDVSKLQFTPQGGDCLYYPPAPTIAP